MYYDGSNWVRLGAGTSGYVLKTAGGSANPVWVAPSALTGVGKVIKVHHYVNNTYQASAASAALPVDNTIPQITEGTEFLVFPMTPVSATSTLLIDVTMQFAASSADNVGAGLFVDSTVNALVANTQYMGGGSPREQNPMRIVYKVVAASTTARTYRVRAGQGSGNGLTFCNGSDDATRNGKYAGKVASTITITEYEA